MKPKKKPPKKRGKRLPAGHQGRGEPKVSTGERRNAFGLVASSDSPDQAVLPQADDSDGRGVRLNRWLAERGVASRRACDALVQEAGVEVNGDIMMEPGYRVMHGDVVKVNGAQVKDVRRLYYLFYKPRGVLCTAEKRETRPRVGDLIDHLVPSRVYPVGRLDEDSEGLLLLTNDGDFAHMMMHPSFSVPKTYVAMIPMQMTHAEAASLRQGAWVDGVKIVPESLKIVRKTRAATMIEVVIKEGRNREVRRLFARHGFGVKRLKRVRIGTLGVKGLRRGGLRPLTRSERDELVSVAKDTGRGAEVEIDAKTGEYKPVRKKFASRKKMMTRKRSDGQVKPMLKKKIMTRKKKGVAKKKVGSGRRGAGRK
ncbi:MAG: rRNA pseudouridine synthase [Planctomycetes bacterium]|nr:rRNA pseudouridine synthase [Planctomycetota bacterium]